MMSALSLLAVVVFAVGLYLLIRQSLRNMDKEVNVPGQPSVWLHIVLLESLIFAYVIFHLAWGALDAISRW